MNPMMSSLPLPVEGTLVRTLLAGDKAATAGIPALTSSGGESMRRLTKAVDAVSVTAGMGAGADASGLAAAAMLVRNGIDPILPLPCSNPAPTALRKDLLSASHAGVHNILVGGDSLDEGHGTGTAPVFDAACMKLLATARAMRVSGPVPSGSPAAEAPSLFLGTTDTPIDPPSDWKPTRLIAKSEAGAQFAQTLPCFDVGVLRRYIARLREEGVTDRLFLLIGTELLASPRSARWVRTTCPSVIMPDSVIARLGRAKDARLEGRRLCVELIQEVVEMDGVAGVHVTARRGQEAIPGILAAAKVGPASRRVH